jgi:hypothetical protein
MKSDRAVNVLMTRFTVATAIAIASAYALSTKHAAADDDDDGGSNPQAVASSTRLIAWNDLGMHCMDPSYSVFALLPPFNDLKSQLIVGGKLQKAATPYVVRYRSAFDADGTVNTTSVGKTDFWDHVQDLFGVALPPNHGLAGHNMPGLLNTPQLTNFDTTWNWFSADGIPITPIDDNGTSDTYPILESIAVNPGTSAQ